MLKLGPIKKLGTIWWFEFFDVEESQSFKLATYLEAEMDRFENLHSRFKSDSELSQLNQNGFFEKPSEEFRKLLAIGEDAYCQTDGVFNIAVGNFLEQSGYDSNYSFKTAEIIKPVPALTDVLEVKSEMVKLKSRAHLDFGGFGKGYLIDHIANLLINEGFSKQFVINGGGDMYITNDNGSPVTIGLQHPIERENIVGTLPLKSMGFAASSPYVRQWQDKNRIHHHLVGNQEAKAVFVVAETAMEADIWATTLAIDKKQTPPLGLAWWLWDETVGLVRQGETGQ